jgi:type II secretory pathway component GspD/PulD (secretin)
MKPLVTLVLALTAALSRAQIDPQGNPVSCEFKRAGIRVVLESLFKQVGMSFTMQKGIAGDISVRLKGVKFGTALMEVLRSSYLTYRIEGGVFEIVRQERGSNEPEPEPTIAMPGLTALKTPAVTARKEPARELLWRILAKSGQNFVIGAQVVAPITGRFPAQLLEETLAAIALKSKSSLNYRSGVWVLGGSYAGSGGY